MKKYLYIFISLILWCCEDNIIELPESFVEKYIDIESSFTSEEFEEMKQFILENGEVYFDDNQPYFYYDSINMKRVRLEPEIGIEANSMYDPNVSDFNIMVLSTKRFSAEENEYQRHSYYLLIVREGDLEDRNIFYEVPEGIQEGKVYIVNYYHEDIDILKTDVLYNLKQIKDKMGDYK